MQFKDKFGRAWTLSMTLQDAWDIENYDFGGQHPKIEILDSGNPQELFAQLQKGAVAFGVAYVLLKRQFEEFNSSAAVLEHKSRPSTIPQEPSLKPIHDEVDFAERIDGDSLDGLKRTVSEVVMGFTPRTRILLKTLIDRSSKAEEIMNRKAEEAVKRELSDENLDSLIEEQLQNVLTEHGFRSGKWRPSSAGTGVS